MKRECSSPSWWCLRETEEIARLLGMIVCLLVWSSAGTSKEPFYLYVWKERQRESREAARKNGARSEEVVDGEAKQNMKR